MKDRGISFLVEIQGLLPVSRPPQNSVEPTQLIKNLFDRKIFTSLFHLFRLTFIFSISPRHTDHQPVSENFKGSLFLTISEFFRYKNKTEHFFSIVGFKIEMMR